MRTLGNNIILKNKMNKHIDISICIITLWRDSIYKTLESIFSQVTQQNYEIIIILQGEVDTRKVDSLNIDNKAIKIINYNSGLGFWYYRNEAIKNSHWDILVWIDDDEYTKDNKWITSISQPIINNQYKVVTAWTDIELWKWYITDCISYLWYPGWWAIWFSKMWQVNSKNETNHLCSWNFAFHKNILNLWIIFDESLKNWAEDNAFAVRLLEKNIKIYYSEWATIYHEARSGIINFCKWHIKRGKSAYEIKTLWLLWWSDAKNKLNTLKYILFDNFFSKFIFWIWIMFILQVICNIYWYIYKSMWIWK